MNDEKTRSRSSRRAQGAGTAILTALILGGSVAASRAAEAPAPKQTLAAGARYEASGFQRFFLGSGYRDLWTLPLEVEVLDLASWSGGLVAEKKGGGRQTQALRFEGADGREWRFRSVDKDPTAVLPSALQDSFAARIVQDQISASHPLGVLVVDALADAVGLPHVEHRLVVLPDDPRLGEFREEFRGMLGTLEENPSVKSPVTPGFERFTKIVDTDELEELLDADSEERVDSRSLLRARLVDLVIGDSDRHRSQWDWARDAESGRFVAVPQDRDLAFVKFEGLLLKPVRQNWVHFVDFEADYPPIVGLAWQARRVDRRYLSDLEWTAWQDAVEELKSRLTDPVIDEATRRLPAPYYRVDGQTMAARLKARRDALPEASRRLYELLAREAEVFGTDEPDALRILRHADGAVEIVLAGSDGPAFRRRFLPGETDEVRVFLKGGDDRALSEGRAEPGVTVRVVGGKGRDVLEDAAGHTRFYDADDDSQVSHGPDTKVFTQPYESPLDRQGNPERDWGAQTRFLPWARASVDYGAVLGAAVERTGFGFRKHPYAHRHTLRAGYSTSLRTGGLLYEYESLRTDSRSRLHVAARASALDLIHYYGLGNETDSTEASGFYDVRVLQLALAPAYRFELSGVDVWLGPVVKYADTKDNAATFLAQERPYGSDRFGQVGARAALNIDRRGLEAGRATGAMLSIEGAVYPEVWSVSETFGRIDGEGVAYLTAPLPLEPTLALRAGGAKVFGRYPFHEAASIGGGGSLRGLPRQRYAGDASAYGNLELRLLLVRRDRALVPRLGVFGLADAGRVFLKSEPSERWHSAFGGGFWLAVGDPKNLVSVSLASSEGDLRFYLHGGFSF